MENSMRENAIVVAVEGDQVRVSVKRRAACASCGACGLGDKAELTVLVANTLGAQVGEEVLLELPTAKLYQAALLVYTLPLAMLIIGFWFGQAVWRRLGLVDNLIEIGAIITGFGLMALTFWAIHCWDRRRQIGARFQPRLVGIIK
jgi:sigma-E factor negative regulatory protein RseC